MWLRSTGASWMMNQAHNLGYYTNLKNTKFDYPNPSFHQIELDLPRTYTV